MRQGAAQWSTIFLFRNQFDIVLLGQCAGRGDFHRQRRGPIDIRMGQRVGGGKAPTAVGDHTNAQAQGLRYP